MKDFAIFILMLLSLAVMVFIWCIPGFMVYKGYPNEWGITYLPIAALTLLYGWQFFATINNLIDQKS